MRHKGILLPLIAISLLLSAITPRIADTAAPAVIAQQTAPASVDGFSLPDAAGKVRAYADLKGYCRVF